MGNGVEAFIPIVLAGGAVLSLILFLIRMGWFQRKKFSRRRLSAFFSHPKPNYQLAVAAVPALPNGHFRSSPIRYSVPTTPFAASQLRRLKESSSQGQSRLLMALTVEQRRQFIEGLNFEGQAELWATLPLETWAEWLAKEISLLPFEQEEFSNLLDFFNQSFRTWATKWDALSSQEQAYLWTQLNLEQQEALWQRLTWLRHMLLQQKKRRQQQIANWEQLKPTAQVMLWSMLSEVERSELWQRYPLASWAATWLALTADVRAVLWRNLNTSQQKRLRHYLETNRPVNNQRSPLFYDRR